MILVTGGTGFLGAYILKELVEQGYAVRAIRRGHAFPAFIDKAILDKVEWIEGDVLDVIGLEEAMTGISQVIHAAGKVSFNPSDKDLLFQVNIEGTANVVNAALAADVQRFVHISSVASLGRSAGENHIDENRTWEDNRRNTAYAISKYQGELEVWRGIAEGLSGVVLNPSIIIGYGNWNSGSASIFRQVYRGFPWYSTGVTGFVDVEDTARAAVQLMQTSISGERYIINGANWSFESLFNKIADSFNVKRPSRKATPFLSGLAWRFERFKSLFGGEPLLTKESAKVALSKSYFDNDKILRALPGFSFTPLERSIENACRHYLNTIF